ncbi:MAG: hypothetical protein EHM61_02915 [Acidobacteria bacterium]|nr:MAG: hypothetical protein EHM61_02915 [Acidobacteriota bacterium]
MKAPRCALPVAAIAFLLMAGLAVSSPNQKQPRTQYPLYILTYDHGGIILWGADQFRQSLRSAVSWLDRYPDFKIGLDNEAYAYDELARNYPEILGELKGYLKKYEGRLGIGTSTYGQPLSAFITEESNIRQIESALRTCEERLGVRPRVYLMSEHAMHSQIPQILEGFAFQGAVMRTHFMMYGYNPTFNVPIGWWIGSDESRLPAIPTYEGEGASFGTTTEDNFILNHYPSKQCQVSLEDYRRHFPRIRPLLASRADDAAVRQEGLVAQYSGHPEYQWILLEELFGLFPRPQAALQTGANDFKTRMPWGYCGNWIWNQGREAEVSVLTAERLAALSWLAGDQSRERRIEEAWKNVLTAQHHDIQICGLLQDADRFLTDSLAASSDVKNASLVFLAGRMGNGGLVQVNVFNPMSWARKEWITARITIRKKAAEGVVVRKGESRLPTLLLADAAVAGSSDRDCLVAFQAEVPGLAVTAYSIDTDPSPTSGTSGIEVDESQLVIRTPDWNVQLSPG